MDMNGEERRGREAIGWEWKGKERCCLNTQYRRMQREIAEDGIGFYSNNKR